MAKFKIVKHRMQYHVIGYTGTKKPRIKGAKPTYREQCISSHWFKNRAKKALESYQDIKLTLSSKEDPRTIRKVFKELHLGIWIAIACGIAYELIAKTYFH